MVLFLDHPKESTVWVGVQGNEARGGHQGARKHASDVHVAIHRRYGIQSRLLGKIQGDAVGIERQPCSVVLGDSGPVAKDVVAPVVVLMRYSRSPFVLLPFLPAV